MASLSFADILRNAKGADRDARVHAQSLLDELQSTNLVNYLGNLSTVLADETAEPGLRMAAGTQLKNALTARSHDMQTKLAERWLQQETSLRDEVKSLLLTALNTNHKNLRNVVAQAIAVVASVELAVGQWPELVPSLLEIVSADGAAPATVESAFVTLGFVCEANQSDVLLSFSSQILTALARGMQPASQPFEVVLAATQALTDALPFCAANIENPTECALALGLISAVMATGDARLAVAGWQCLVELAELYYDALEPHIESIFVASCNALAPAVAACAGAAQGAAVTVLDEDEAKLPSIVVMLWLVLAQHERHVQEQLQELEDEGEDDAGAAGGPGMTVRDYAAKAQSSLTPLLLALLVQTPDGQEDSDESTLSNLAASCLKEFSYVVGAPMLPAVLTYTHAGLSGNPAADWRVADGALTALGCYLESPHSAEAREPVAALLPAILARLQPEHAPHAPVRAAAAWCLRMVAGAFPSIFAPPEALRMLIEAVMPTLDDDFSVLRFSVAILYVLCEAVEQSDEDGGEAEEGALPANAFSPYFMDLVGKLLARATAAAESSDVALQTQVCCFDLVAQLVKYSHADVQDQVEQLLPHLCSQLEHSIQAAAQLTEGSERLEEVGNMQAQLCGALSSTLVRMHVNGIAQHADRLVNTFVAVLQSNTVASAATVGEDALQALGELARRAAAAFAPYLPLVAPVLVRALSDPTNTHLCVTGVYTVSRVCIALEGTQISTDVMDPLMSALLSAFSAEADVDRSVKSAIVEVLSDLALAMGAQFTHYLTAVMALLVPASEMSLTASHSAADLADDADTVAFLIKLQQMFLQCYTAIVALCFEEGCPQHVAACVEPMLAFASSLMKDSELITTTLAQAADLVHDICVHANTMHPTMPAAVLQWGAQAIAAKAAGSTRKKAKKAGVAARKAIENMVAQAQAAGHL